MKPWSKGDYSWCIPEAIMVMERPLEVNPPSGRAPGQLLPVIPRSESRRRQNNGQNHVTVGSSRVTVSGAKYMPKEGLRGGPPGCASQPPSGFWSLQTWIFFGIFINLPCTFIF